MDRVLFIGMTLCLAAGGCYSYRPIDVSDVRSEMEVRARLSTSQAEELSEALPLEDRLLEGTVVDNSSMELTLLVPVAHTSRSGRVETLSQRLGIPWSGILEVELKQLDRWRTGILSATGALFVGFVLYKTLGEGSSSETPGGGPGPQEALIPIRPPVGR